MDRGGACGGVEPRINDKRQQKKRQRRERRQQLAGRINRQFVSALDDQDAKPGKDASRRLLKKACVCALLESID